MSGTFVGLNSHITEGFTNVLDGVAATTGGWMGYLFSAATLSLYFAWRSYQMLLLGKNVTYGEIVWDVSKMLFIMVFVTNAGGYLDMVTSAVNGLRDGLSGGTSIWERLDTVWEKAQRLGEDLYNKDDSKYVPAKGLLAQTLVWAGVALLVGITAIINLVADLLLRLMLATAPIFIFCLMWSWFRDMFSNWLKTIISCLLTTYFSGIALTVVMDYLDYILSSAQHATQANYLTLGIQVFLGALGAAAVMNLCAKLASSLAGASAQAAAQGMASAGLSAGARAAGAEGAKVAGAAADKAGAAAHAVGSKAADYIKDKLKDKFPGSGDSMAEKRKAAIERQIARNSRK
jgi:type IV secretion system protein VirB6